jgi:hypothetical protein
MKETKVFDFSQNHQTVKLHQLLQFFLKNRRASNEYLVMPEK